MLCYKDKTWCPFGKSCDNAKKCDRVLTKEIKRKATEINLLIAQYSSPPKDCYKKKEISNAKA